MKYLFLLLLTGCIVEAPKGSEKPKNQKVLKVLEDKCSKGEIKYKLKIFASSGTGIWYCNLVSSKGAAECWTYKRYYDSISFGDATVLSQRCGK